MKRIAIIIIYLLGLHSLPVSAGLYSACIKGYDFGASVKESFALYPINSDCYTQCDVQCNSSFSQLTAAGAQLNVDVIDRCKAFCQSRVSFSSYYRVQSIDPTTNIATISLAGPVSFSNSPSSCATDQVWNRVYKSQNSFHMGDSFIIGAAASSASPNKIYSCGKDTIQIKSIFQDNLSANWSGTQTFWTDQTQHYCLNSTTDALANLTVANLVGPTPLNYSSIQTNIPSQPLPYADADTSTPGNLLPDYRTANDLLAWYRASNGPCKFSARQESMTSTGLYVQDGDELSIFWKGNYSPFPSTYSPGNICNRAGGSVRGLSLNNLIMCARNASIDSSYQVTPDGASSFIPNADTCNAMARLDSILKLSFNNGSNASSVALNGEDARTSPIFTPSSRQTSNTTIAADSYYAGSSYNFCSPRYSTGSNSGSSIISVYGLAGSVQDDVSPQLNTPYPNNSYYSMCQNFWNGASNSCPNNDCSLCYYINGMDYSTYSYGGVLKGISSSRSLLSIGVFDSVNSYADNIGGVTATINWGGCPITPTSTDPQGNPNVIQYLVSRCDLDPSMMYDNFATIPNLNTQISYSWTHAVIGSTVTIPSNAAMQNICGGSGTCSDGSSCSCGNSCSNGSACDCSSVKCCLYLRVDDKYITQDGSGNVGINPTPAGVTGLSSSTASLANLYGNAGNRNGYFSLTIGTPIASFVLPTATTTGPMQSLVAYLNNHTLGSAKNNYSGGVLNSFYTKVISNNGYNRMIMALLSMYMAFLGAGFIMGTVKIELKELVTRLFKISFIVMLISNTSWTFFSSYILPGIVDGAANLASSFVINVANSTKLSGFPNGYETLVANDPSTLIALMVDQPLKYMWGSSTLWIKVSALLFSAWWGMPFFLILVTSMIVYSIALLKIVLIYCIALIGVAVMIFIAPLTIPMMMFKFTEQIFESWWKLLLSYAIQPVMLFAGVSVLNFLTLMVFYSALSFTVCPYYCLFGIEFAGISKCAAYVYTILDSLHSPTESHGALPMPLIHCSSLFLLLSYIMFEMPSMFTSIASKITTGNAMGNVGRASDQAFGQYGLGKAQNMFFDDPETYSESAYNRFLNSSGVQIARAIGNRGMLEAAALYEKHNRKADPTSIAAPPLTAAQKAEAKEVMPKNIAQSGGIKKSSKAPSLSTIIEEGEEGED